MQYTELEVSIFRNPLFTIKFKASIIPIKNPLATMAGIMGTKISPNVLIPRLIMGKQFLLQDIIRKEKK